MDIGNRSDSRSIEKNVDDAVDVEYEIDIDENERPIKAPIDDGEQLADDPLITDDFPEGDGSYTVDADQLNLPSAGNSKVAKINCGNCQALFTNYLGLCDHLVSVHHITANVHTICLNSWTEYELWKQQVSYMGEFQWRTRHSKKDVYALLTCHRSGHTEHPGAGKRPPRRKVKIGFECSCFAHAKRQRDDSIIVRYCLEHYGHEKDDSLLKRKYPQITFIMDDNDDGNPEFKPTITEPKKKFKHNSTKTFGVSMSQKTPDASSESPIIVTYQILDNQPMYYIIEGEDAIIAAQTFNDATETVELNGERMLVVTDPALIEHILSIDHEQTEEVTATLHEAIEVDDSVLASSDIPSELIIESVKFEENEELPKSINDQVLVQRTQQSEDLIKPKSKRRRTNKDDEEILDVVDS